MKNNDESIGEDNKSLTRCGKLDSTFISQGGELSLSNQGQMELLQAMNERGMILRTMVLGYSMYPFIKNRDLLTIAPLLSLRPQVGEVVAFSHTGSGRLVIHRIIACKDNCWLLKGDNSTVTDGLITNNNLLGRVIKVERLGKEIKLGNRAGISTNLIVLLSKQNLLIGTVKMFTLPKRLARLLRKHIIFMIKKSTGPK